MTTEIWMDFDQDQTIPFDLKNARVTNQETEDGVLEEPEDGTEDVQDDTSDDEDFDETDTGDALGTPSSFVIESQTVRIGPDGTQLVDIVIDVEEIPGAIDYDYRITPAT